MITSIWDSATSYKQQNSPYQAPATNTPVGQLQLASAQAAVGELVQQIDLGDVQNIGDVGAVELEITNPQNGAPSAGQNVTMWAAFSSSGSKQPPELLTAATSLVCAPSQVPGRTQVFMMPLFYMGARYLYVWFDQTALAAVPLNLRLRVNAKKS